MEQNLNYVKKEKQISWPLLEKENMDNTTNLLLPSPNDMNNNKINIENEISNLKTEISTINNFLSDDEQNSLENLVSF